MCILVYLKTYALQVVQGRLFGMVQGKAYQWMHVLLAARRTLGNAPARSLTALAQRLGVSEADAATVVTPPAEEATPGAITPATAPASPLWLMTGLRGAASVPEMLLHRLHVRAARQRIIRSNMCGLSMPCARFAFGATPTAAVS